MPKGYTDKPTPNRFQKGIIPWNKGTGEKYKIKICSICGKEFHNKSTKTKTCSKECRYISCSQKNTRVKRICAICGKEFEVPVAWIKRNRPCNEGTYCSKKCRYTNKINYSYKNKTGAINCIRIALLKGIIKKQNCCICNSEKSEAHHYAGYKKENWLKIVWYCHKHHLQEHERLRRTGQSELL